MGTQTSPSPHQEMRAISPISPPCNTERAQPLPLDVHTTRVKNNQTQSTRLDSRYQFIANLVPTVCSQPRIAYRSFGRFVWRAGQRGPLTRLPPRCKPRRMLHRRHVTNPCNPCNPRNGQKGHHGVKCQCIRRQVLEHQLCGLAMKHTSVESVPYRTRRSLAPVPVALLASQDAGAQRIRGCHRPQDFFSQLQRPK